MIVSPTQFADDTVHTAQQHNDPLNELAEAINGNLSNENIADDAAIDGSKLASSSIPNAQLSHNAAWTSWTPTWTTLTIGNATVSATYQQIGKTVNFQILVTLGSTTTMGSVTPPTFTLPVAASSFTNGAGKVVPLGCATAYDTSASLYFSLAAATSNSTTVGTVLRPSSDPVQLSPLSSALPFTWATGDTIGIRGTYEAA